MKAVWDHFLQTKEWPKGKSFRKTHGRPNVEKVITNLSPLFIWYTKENFSEGYYKLTSAGVYAVEGLEGKHIKLILPYLDYLRKKFNENPEFKKVTAKELKEFSGMASEEVRILGEFLAMGDISLWGISGSNIQSSDWEVGVIDDIEDLYEAKNSKEFLLKKLNDGIEWNIKYPDRFSTHPIPDILGIKKSQVKPRTVLEPKHQIISSDDLETLFDSANLHNKVKSSSKSLFVTNHFSQAILEALKSLESEIKEISKLDSYGQDLMAKAFKENEPKIKLNTMRDITEKDEQEGFRFIFMGVMKGIRNPIAHNNISWNDPSLALKYLCMISLLFEKLDDRIFPKE